MAVPSSALSPLSAEFPPLPCCACFSLRCLAALLALLARVLEYLLPSESLPLLMSASTGVGALTVGLIPRVHTIFLPRPEISSR